LGKGRKMKKQTRKGHSTIRTQNIGIESKAREKEESN
jgi:hypothetical protein